MNHLYYRKNISTDKVVTTTHEVSENEINKDMFININKICLENFFKELCKLCKLLNHAWQDLGILQMTIKHINLVCLLKDALCYLQSSQKLRYKDYFSCQESNASFCKPIHTRITYHRQIFLDYLIRTDG